MSRSHFSAGLHSGPYRPWAVTSGDPLNMQCQCRAMAMTPICLWHGRRLGLSLYDFNLSNRSSSLARSTLVEKPVTQGSHIYPTSLRRNKAKEIRKIEVDAKF